MIYDSFHFICDKDQGKLKQMLQNPNCCWDLWRNSEER